MQAEKSYRDLAIRMDGCTDNWIELVTGIIGCSESDALAILDLYRANKVVKRDLTNQRWTVKHGAYLDADTLTSMLEK